MLATQARAGLFWGAGGQWGGGSTWPGSGSSLGQNPLDDFAQVPSPPRVMVCLSVEQENDTWRLCPGRHNLAASILGSTDIKRLLCAGIL